VPINRVAAWGITIVLLVASAGASYWYVTVPLRQQRWERWHNYNMEQIGKALAGEDTLRIGRAPDEQTKPLQARYEVGLKKARAAHAAWNKLQEQSRYTAKVLGVTVDVLKAGNAVGLDALREPLRDVFSEQRDLSSYFDNTQTSLKEVRQQLIVDWRKLWPGNKLQIAYKPFVATMSAEEWKRAEQVLADLTAMENADREKYGAIIEARVPDKDGKGSNLTPYEEDKYQAAWARKQLYLKVHVALDEAYRALGGPTEEALQTESRKHLVEALDQAEEMDDQTEKIRQELEELKK
jgi:hypothetical protein